MPLPAQNRYAVARSKALGRLMDRLDRSRLSALGVRAAAEEAGEGAGFVLPALRWELRVCLQPYGMWLLPGEGEVSIVWQILALNYLAAPEPRPPTGFVSFGDLGEGRSYQGAYEGRVVRRLSHSVGGRRDTFVDAARRLGGAPTEGEPVRCILRFFPLLEFQLVRYEGDEDFPPACNVLLSDNVLSLFSVEDATVAAETLVGAMAGRTPAAPRQRDAQ